MPAPPSESASGAISPPMRPNERRAMAPALVILPALTIALTVGLFWKQTADDPFIYLRFARHWIATGEIAFNPGQPLVGFTSVWHFLVASLLAAAFDDLEAALYLLGAVLNGLAVAMLVLWLCRAAAPSGRGPRPPPWVLATFPLWLGFDSLSVASIGMESGWLMFGILACLWLYYFRSESLAIGLSGLLIWVRPDAAVLPPVLLIDYVVRRRRVPWGALIALGVCAAGWMAFNRWAAGEWLPSTMAAKRAQMDSGWMDRGFGRKLFLAGFPRHEKHYAYYLILAVFCWRFLWAMWRQPAWRRLGLIPLWAAIYAVVYSALGVPYIYFWYYIPLVAAIHLMAGLGGVAWVAETPRGGARWRRWVRRIALAAALIYPWIMLVHNVHDPHVARRAALTRSYRAAADYLRDHAAPESTIAAVEIGVFGYALPNPLIDLSGIVTPEVIESIRHGDADRPFALLEPQYVICHDPPYPPEEPIVGGRYGERYERVFTGHAPNTGLAPVRIFRRRD